MLKICLGPIRKKCLCKRKLKKSRRKNKLKRRNKKKKKIIKE
jgi:hypothetical protein